MALKVQLFPTLQDNYNFLVTCSETQTRAVVDPSGFEPIGSHLDQENLDLILNTHHHWDHVGGNIEMKKKWDCRILGPEKEAEDIPGLDQALKGADQVRVGLQEAMVIDIPGHTRGHIAYYFAESKVLFSGDTLFAMGCGRLFEGTALQLKSSLERLSQLPDETKVYCAHEYTAKNGQFALTIDPTNLALQKRTQEIQTQNITIPTVIEKEKLTNPFLRAHDPKIRSQLGMSHASDLEVFTEIRRRRDHY